MLIRLQVTGTAQTRAPSEGQMLLGFYSRKLQTELREKQKSHQKSRK
jgi:hypothetical protein